jgi:hypothetical protein
MISFKIYLFDIIMYLMPKKYIDLKKNIIKYYVNIIYIICLLIMKRPFFYFYV